MTDNGKLDKFEMVCASSIIAFFLMFVGLFVSSSLLLVDLISRETRDWIMGYVVGVTMVGNFVFWVALLLMDVFGFIRRIFKE